ncbi:MAG: hypothetical protein ACFCVD_15410 [Nodosilinea sp.]
MTVSQQHQGQGAEVVSIDWTLAHHGRSEPIYGVKRSYDLLAYRKRTEMVVELVQQIESEGPFPNAPYAVDNGVLVPSPD